MKVKGFFLGFLLSASTVWAEGECLTLTAALERAMETDPRVMNLRAQFDAGKEDGHQIRATRRPTLDAFGSASLNSSDSDSPFFGERRETYPSFQAGLEARQPVYRRDWSQRAQRARGLEMRAEAELDLNLQSYFFAVAESFIGAILAQENLSLAETEAEAVEESLRDTRNRYEAETIAKTDLYEAEARDDLAKARLLSAEQALADAVERLEEAIGPVEDLPRLTEAVDLGDVLQGDVDFWWERARASSPALMASRAFARVAASEVDARLAERAPQVDLFGQVLRTDTSESRVGERGTDARVGLEINIPLYRGGGIDSSVRQARALRRAADYELDSRERELRRQVRDAWRGLEVAGREVAAFRAAVRSAEAAEEATANGFEAGTRTVLDVLNARSATVEAKRNLSRARHQMLLSQIRLHQLAGVLDLEALQKFDPLFE